jgi:hypothetical protein
MDEQHGVTLADVENMDDELRAGWSLGRWSCGGQVLSGWSCGGRVSSGQVSRLRVRDLRAQRVRSRRLWSCLGRRR